MKMPCSRWVCLAAFALGCSSSPPSLPADPGPAAPDFADVADVTDTPPAPDDSPALPDLSRPDLFEALPDLPPDPGLPDIPDPGTTVDVCTPSCGPRVCGDDGCGGSCGTCVPGKACQDGVCACIPKDHKACCNQAVCWFDGCGAMGEKVADCPKGCKDGVCEGCSPDCIGKVCGDDGCGADCGTCAAGVCDGLGWTPPEACESGSCQPVPAQDCDDDDGCTVDSCDPAAGCGHAAVKDGTACVAGSCAGTVWTKPKTCLAGKCAAGGGMQKCDDADVCTEDTCDAVTGCGAKKGADGVACAPGTCAGTTWIQPKTCLAGKCAGGGGLQQCKDDNGCTVDTCDPVAGCLFPSGNSPCDDGDPCTTGDACSGGVCKGTGMLDCDDKRDCTIDSCDPKAGCVHALAIGACLIDGKCVPAGLVEPGNPCRACAAQKSTSAWTPVDDGTECEASLCQGASWIAARTFKAGKCSAGGEAVACDDGLDCTAESCSPTGGCASKLVGGRCLIDGACVSENQAKPGEPCRQCLPAKSTSAWSTAVDGTGCATGSCTGLSWLPAKSCNSGSCVAGGVPRTCDDALECTTDSCIPATGCENVLRSGSCRIAGSCVGDGEGDPSNPCLVCSAAKDPAAWTVRADGTQCAPPKCSAGEWTAARTCQAGQCAGGGSSKACDDQVSCTIDTCDPILGCSNVLQEGSCRIDGNCMVEGSSNTDDPCKVCSPSASTAAWSPAPDGRGCAAGSCNGLTWIPGQTCAGGSCAGGGGSQSCDDGKSCTTDSCDADKGCGHTLAGGYCLIGGTCYGDGQPRVTNACQVCDASGDVSTWSPVMDGSVCLAPSCVGKTWNWAKTCAGGTCTGGGGSQDCDDGRECTTDTCEPANGCNHAVVAGYCLIGGICYGDGAPNPANPCQACVTGKSTSSWSPAADGQACLPASCTGLLWTAPKLCVAGACTGGGATKDCDDGRDCTVDSCDPMSVCGHSLQAGACLIAGSCLAGGAPNPSNSCQACEPSTAANSWSAVPDGRECKAGSCSGKTWTARMTCAAGVCTGGDSVDCDDGNACTTDSCVAPTGCMHANNTAQCSAARCEGGRFLPATTCSQGVCPVQVPENCNDGKDCTDDTCSPTTGCGHPVQAGFCLIGGTCYSDSDFNPANSCRRCLPSTSQNGWTNAANGTGCMAGTCDGLVWKAGKTCVDGACTGGGGSESCDDGKTCTLDACNPASGCARTPASGSCLIGGVCYTAGQPAPGNACQVCDPARSTTAWSAAEDGKACGEGSCAGLFWTAPRICHAGVCTGDSLLCNDGQDCTTDTCNPVSGCGYELQTGACLIGGGCYGEGQPNPSSPCLVCRPATNTSQWSAEIDGRTCQLASCSGLVLTALKRCSAGTCLASGPDKNCADGNACTTDTCDRWAGCGNVLQPGTCAIGGTCYKDGDANPANSCQVCDAVASPNAWTSAVDGKVCAAATCSGTTLTTARTCLAGKCAAGGTTQACTDALACTNDACVPETGCVYTQKPGSCLIDGKCYGAGYKVDKCTQCDPTKSTSSWTYMAGSPCDDGFACTSGDVCRPGYQGEAGCRGTSYSCYDGKDCTSDVCDGKGGCSNPVMDGSCLIGGKCYTVGTANPANPCEGCTTTYKNDWTDLDGDSCDDGNPDTFGSLCKAGYCIPRWAKIGECVVDRATGNYWWFPQSCTVTGTWDQANTDCEEATRCGFDDWHLPAKVCNLETNEHHWSQCDNSESCTDPVFNLGSGTYYWSARPNLEFRHFTIWQPSASTRAAPSPFG